MCLAKNVDIYVCGWKVDIWYGSGLAYIILSMELPIDLPIHIPPPLNKSPKLEKVNYIYRFLPKSDTPSLSKLNLNTI